VRILVTGPTAVVGRPLVGASRARGHRLTAAQGAADDRARAVLGRQPVGPSRPDGLGRE
jgi:hypothetical protein